LARDLQYQPQACLGEEIGATYEEEAPWKNGKMGGS